MRARGKPVVVSGEKRMKAPRAVVWDVISDPTEMVRMMPGVEEVTKLDEGRFRATAHLPGGPRRLKLSIDFERTEERDLEYASMAGRGHAPGVDFAMTTSFTLSDGEEETIVDWEAQVAIGGPLGRLAGRALKPVVEHEVKGVLSTLEARVAEQVRSAS